MRSEVLKTARKGHYASISENPYGKVLFLVDPRSHEIVDVDRDECDDGEEYEVSVEPKLDETWNLMPVLKRLFTFEYALSGPLPRNSIPSESRTSNAMPK